MQAEDGRGRLQWGNPHRENRVIRDGSLEGSQGRPRIYITFRHAVEVSVAEHLEEPKVETEVRHREIRPDHPRRGWVLLSALVEQRHERVHFACGGVLGALGEL